MRTLPFLAVLGLAASFLPGPLAAQDGWNETRVLEMVAQARSERSRVVEDDSLQNYAADATGFVYFYVDRRDSDETALVKTDQVALEVYWKAPDSTKQRIVGLRDEEALPTNVQYHLDHLTVVQDDYADVIRLGDGDEVAAVIHPMAPGSESTYDFRLADSIAIDLGGGRDEVRVYEVDVRPRDFTRPGFIGSVFLDRDSGAIVRMSFTFTAASYVDDYLDYIRISLDNSLWDGRYWLPYEQRVEIRRELPYFDFPAGSVIRGRYEIRNYRFNEALGPFLFLGGRVSAVPRGERESFAFEEDLHAQLDREGLGPLPELADIRAEAARMAGEQALSGLGRFRPWVPDGAWLTRFNRAEGSAVGLGASYRTGDTQALKVGVGYAFGRRRPYATARFEGTGSLRWGVSAHLNQLGEIGGRATASSALNTFAGTLTEKDYTDPYFSSGGGIEVQYVPGAIRWGASLQVQEDRAASLVTDLERPVRIIDEGTRLELGLSVESPNSQGPGWSASLVTGRLEDRSYMTMDGSVGWSRHSLEDGYHLDATLSGGWTSSSAPLQTRTLMGGRGTLIGYPYRGWAGDRWTLFHVEGARDVVSPWLRLGVFGSVGSTWLRDNSIPESWAASSTGQQARFSAGFTAHAFWELIRLDVGRGLNGGKWGAQISLTRRFWHLL